MGNISLRDRDTVTAAERGREFCAGSFSPVDSPRSRGGPLTQCRDRRTRGEDLQ